MHQRAATHGWSGFNQSNMSRDPGQLIPARMPSTECSADAAIAGIVKVSQGPKQPASDMAWVLLGQPQVAPAEVLFRKNGQSAFRHGSDRGRAGAARIVGLQSQFKQPVIESSLPGVHQSQLSEVVSRPPACHRFGALQGSNVLVMLWALRRQAFVESISHGEKGMEQLRSSLLACFYRCFQPVPDNGFLVK